MTEHRCTGLRETEILFCGPYRRKVECSCGWSLERPMERIAAVQRFAEHYAVEEQAAKPRARRGGTDDSTPGSPSHKAVLAAMWRIDHIWQDRWVTADEVHPHTDYSPQRVRTCLAGLVRAGLVEERKVGKHREYRLADVARAASAPPDILV